MDYNKDFVKEYGNFMFNLGILRFGKNDSLSRALYSENLLKNIASIKSDEQWGRMYDSICGERKDMSLEEIEKGCNLSIRLWRKEDKQ